MHVTPCWKVTLGLALALISVVQPYIRWIVIAYLSGWIVRTHHEHVDHLPNAPVVDNWTCDGNTLRYEPHFRTVQCRGRGEPLTVEWTLLEAPFNDRPFLATLIPNASTGTSWEQWKRRKNIAGKLVPILPFQSARDDWPAPKPTPRSELYAKLTDHFSVKTSGLLLALFAGDKSHLDGDIKSALNRAGLAHLMAVSGYHVGLIATFSVLLLRHRRLVFRMIGFLGLVPVWLFIAFCGSPDSAIRAGVMLTLYGCYQLGYGAPNGLHLMSLTAWAMLLQDPSISDALGTQLSFVAVTAILVAMALLNSRNQANRMSLLVAIPLAAQWGTLFLSQPIFGLFPVHFLLLNLAASLIMLPLGMGFGGWCLMEAIGNPTNLLHGLSKGIEALVAAALEFLLDERWGPTAIEVHAMPVGWWWVLSGVFFGGAWMELQWPGRFRRWWFRTVIGLAVATPWLWLFHHQAVEVQLRHFPIISFPARHSNTALIFAEDSPVFSRRQRPFNLEDAQEIELFPKSFWSDDEGNWLLRSTATSAFGEIKNRPISLCQLGDSSISLAFGADSSFATAWGDPVRFRCKLVNSNAIGW